LDPDGAPPTKASPITPERSTSSIRKTSKAAQSQKRNRPHLKVRAISLF
jgi:hypothetical protein